MLAKIYSLLKQLTGFLAINFLTLGLIKLEMLPARGVMVGQRPTNSSGQFKEPLFKAPPPPPDVDSSDNRSDGGSRGCEDVANQSTGSEQKTLTALAPVYQIKDRNSVGGLTVSANPTLWFYVPYNSKSSADFVLYDQENKPVYKAPFIPSGRSGVVKISLPSSVSLQIDRQYQWYFKIYCQRGQPPRSVTGRIKRVNFSNPALRSQLEKATLSDRVSLLAANGIWYDALTAAAEVRQTDPNDSNWSSLLRQIDLSTIASEPIVDCCQK